MGGRGRNCRLWWPSNLFSQTPPNSSFLFGWFLPSSGTSSFDVVIAFASDELNLTSSLNSGLDLPVRFLFPIIKCSCSLFLFIFFIILYFFWLVGLDAIYT